MKGMPALATTNKPRKKNDCCAKFTSKIPAARVPWNAKLIEKWLVENVIVPIELNINRPLNTNAVLKRIIAIKNVNFNCEIQSQISIANKSKLNRKADV